MEGQDIRGLMEAYSQVHEIPEVLNEEVVEEDIEVLDEQGGTDRAATRRSQERARIERDRLIQQAGGGAKGEADRKAGKEAQRAKLGLAPGGSTLNTDARYRTRQSGEANLRKLGGGDLNKGIEAFRKKQEADKKAKTTPPADGGGGGGGGGGSRPVPASQTVLAKKGGVEGKLDKATGKFTAGAFSDAEKSRYSSASATKPAAPAASSKPAAPAAPAKPAPGTKAAGPESIKPKTPNPLMQKTFGYQTGNAPDQIKKASEGKPVPSGSALGSAADPKVRAALNLPSKPAASLSQKPEAPKPEAPKPQMSARAQALKAGGPAGGARERMLNQGVDIFDLVKGHLLDEGYAETEENALVIMTNMSEEWRDEIVERYKGKHGQSSDEYKDDRSPGGKMVSGDSKRSGAEWTHGRRVKAENPGSQPDEGGKTTPKSQGRMDAGSREDLMYRKANLKRKHRIEKKLEKEEVEYVDENRRAARSAGGYKDDSKKQSDPSKEGFTGVGNMSIKDIMALNKRIEARKAKKEETQVEGEQIDEVLGGQAGDGYIGHPRLGIKNPMAKKQTPTKTSSNTGIAGKLGNRASQMDAAMKAARGQ